jgi:hypothetical protein
MSSSLLIFPLPFSDPVVQNVLHILSASYKRSQQIEDLVDDVGVDATRIDLDGSSRKIWRSVLREAARTQQIEVLLTHVAQDSPALAPVIEESLGPSAPTPPPEEEDTDGRITWKGFSDTGEERRIVEGEDTLLNIAFLQQGLDRAPSVCKLRVKIGPKRYVGTAFCIAPDLLLTNHHVLFRTVEDTEEAASEVEAWFGYELDRRGVPLAPTVIGCDPDSIQGSAERDWGVVRVLDSIPDQFPVLPIGSTATEVKVDDRVYIIQHPGGRAKMIGMHHNVVRFVDDAVLQYWTDTEAGSSGAPVFDEEWNVVALHHRWVERDVDGTMEFRNQGQRIERVVEELVAAGLTFGSPP